jgi:hypothetical protein
LMYLFLLDTVSMTSLLLWSRLWNFECQLHLRMSKKQQWQSHNLEDYILIT